MEKQRELKAIAKVIYLLTKEVVENPTISIRDAYRYVLREITTPTLASESAYNDFYLKTGKDIRTFDWRSSRRITSKNGEKFSIHKVYTGDHIQTCRDFEIMLKKAYEKGLLTEDFIIEQLNNRHVCWITKEEDRILNELGYKSNRSDPKKAYREAGIIIYQDLDNAVSLEAKPDKNISLSPNVRERKNKSDGVSISQNTTVFGASDTFTFENKIKRNKIQKRKINVCGFATYDINGRLVGVTHMHKQREAAYGQAEICFFEEYEADFGVWRLVSINKERLLYKKLTEVLEDKGLYKITIDPRR